MQQRVESVLQKHLASARAQLPTNKTCSAAQAYVSVDGHVEVDAAWGVCDFESGVPVQLDTPFDIASVSKLFTATAAMIGVDEGRWSFDTRIHDILPDFPESEITLLHLMNHSSGLPAWDQFYLRLPFSWTPAVATANKAVIRRETFAKDLKPAGSIHAYSDLGYMTLGWALESVFDAPLDDIVQTRILDPLGLDYTRYVSVHKGDLALENCVSTEYVEERGGPVHGVVHDENTYIQGGVAGHAGLFSIAGDLGIFGEHMLAIDNGWNGIVSRETLQFCWSEAARGAQGHHVGGWDTPSGESTSVGQGFNHAATRGHLGFTGTSLWIDRSRKTVAVLLTNRVYPTRENPNIKALRIAFHEAVIQPS